MRRSGTRAAVTAAVVCCFLVLAVLMVGSVPHACNGVQLCPIAGLRASRALGWVAAVVVGGVAACASCLLRPASAPIALVLLAVLGAVGAAATLLAAGF